MRKVSRREWVGGAFEALTEGGIESLRVEPLAARLGVTKGSFYHHFANRRALHLAMLEEWERLGTSGIIEQVEHGDDDAAVRLHRLACRIFAEDPFADAIETGIRSWAATDEIVAAAVARVDKRRLDYVASLLRRHGLHRAVAQRRARLLYRTLIGEFVWRSAGGPASTRRDLTEMTDLLLDQR